MTSYEQYKPSTTEMKSGSKLNFCATCIARTVKKGGQIIRHCEIDGQFSLSRLDHFRVLNEYFNRFHIQLPKCILRLKSPKEKFRYICPKVFHDAGCSGIFMKRNPLYIVEHLTYFAIKNLFALSTFHYYFTSSSAKFMHPLKKLSLYHSISNMPCESLILKTELYTY